MQPLKLWGDTNIAPATQPISAILPEITDGLYDDDIERDKARIKKNGEIFTPMALVEEMLDQLKFDWTNPELTTIDPACGNGQFIIAIIRRKLAGGSTPVQACSTVYGIELMQDNVDATRKRILDMVGSTPELKRIVHNNIACGNSLTWDFNNWKTGENL